MKTPRQFLIFSILAISVFGAYAQQVEYHYFDKRDGVKIEYRWSLSNLLNRNSDAVLYLQMTNENDYPVSISYKVGFFRNELLFLESGLGELCLNPGQRRRGSRTDMRYSARDIKMPMTGEEWFSWDLVEFDVEEASCK